MQNADPKLRSNIQDSDFLIQIWFNFNVIQEILKHQASGLC